MLSTSDRRTPRHCSSTSRPVGSGRAPPRRPRCRRSRDVLEAVVAVRAEVAERAGLDVDLLPADRMLVSSSAGGGLLDPSWATRSRPARWPGHRVALTAGGVVVHVHSGPLDWAGLSALRAARPDVVLLTGGTDGGNGEVLLHNARRLAGERRGAPVVIAGNAEVADEAAALLRGTGQRVQVVANVMPRIGQLVPEPARAAIRELFLRHVIGGKRLSRSRLEEMSFPHLVRTSTPDAMLAGVGVLADQAGDVLVIDVGGSTTDVCSALGEVTLDELAGRRQAGAAAGPAAHGRGRSRHGAAPRRWSSRRSQRGCWTVRSRPWPARVRCSRPTPGRWPSSRRTCRSPSSERGAEVQLATLAVRVAVRRHGRPARPGPDGRPLQRVAWMVGGGGVLRCAAPDARRSILEPLTIDHGGGWPVPDRGSLGRRRAVPAVRGRSARRHPSGGRGDAGRSGAARRDPPEE